MLGSQSDFRSDVEVSAKSTLKELKIVQENVGFGSATFPLPIGSATFPLPTISLQDCRQGPSVHFAIPRTLYEQTLEVSTRVLLSSPVSHTPARAPGDNITIFQNDFSSGVSSDKGTLMGAS